MKKLLSVFLVLVMVMSFSVTAFAEGGFLSSPSANLAPEIIEPTDGSVVIHSYAERDKLTEKQREDIEDAYDSIKNNADLTKINSQLGKIAKDKKVNPSSLAVSDLFNVGYNGKGAAGTKTIKLRAETLNNFTALMVYVNGVWQIVDGANIEGGNLVFDAENYGPYAIVVNTNTTTSPQTGVSGNVNTESTGVNIYMVLMLVSACGALVMWRLSKKYTA